MKILLHHTTKILLLLIYIAIPEITSAQWSAPVNLSPGALSAGLNESMGSCIGVSGDTIHVVYGDRFNTTHGAIYYTRSIDTGLTWSVPVAITDINANAWNAAIAVNGSNIHVVWREIDTLSNHRNSHYNHSLDGGNTWGTDMTIDTAVADWPAVAVSGNHVYVANDIVTSAVPYNTEIFFLQSVDNGFTWSSHEQITFSVGRSEDEAIIAQGPHIFMSWNDNRSGQMQIFTKHSTDYGATWDSDLVVIPPLGYGTMVWIDSAHVDVVAAGAPSGHYQILLAQSADTGATWATDMDLTNDTANTYYYPDMVRDGSDLHVTYVKSGVGGQYLHSGDGGSTWDAPHSFGNSGITPFIAYSGCMLHVILPDSGHINYFRNPTGNGGVHCLATTGIFSLVLQEQRANVYPNPFTSQTTIEISSSGNPERSVLKVYDLYGREVISTVFGNKNEVLLGIDKLNVGIYLYKVLQKEKIIATGKIVVE